MATAPALDCPTRALRSRKAPNWSSAATRRCCSIDPDSVWLSSPAGSRSSPSTSTTARRSGAPPSLLHGRAHGDALFGMDLDGYGEGQGLLAVGVVGTRLLERRARPAASATRDPGARRRASRRLVDRWVDRPVGGRRAAIVPASAGRRAARRRRRRRRSRAGRRVQGAQGRRRGSGTSRARRCSSAWRSCRSRHRRRSFPLTPDTLAAGARTASAVDASTRGAALAEAMRCGRASTRSTARCSAASSSTRAWPPPTS